MKQFIISYFSINPYQHEVSIYKNNYGGDYLIYFDGEFWTTIDNLYEFENELEFIENCFHTKIYFPGF